MSMFPNHNKPSDDEYKVPNFGGANVENAEVAHEALTLDQLKGIFDAVPESADDKPIQILLTDNDGNPRMDATIVGLALDENTGSFTLLVYPGTLSEWQSGGSDHEHGH